MCLIFLTAHTNSGIQYNRKYFFGIMLLIYLWNHTVRINDKAITLVTGLVLLLGVGTLAHKGDELFASKAGKTEIAANGPDYPPTTDNTSGPEMLSVNHKTNTLDIAKILPVETSDTLGIKFDEGIQTASVLVKPPKQSIIKIDPIQTDCRLNLSAKSLRGARIKLELIAPCHINKVVTIAHAGLRFNEIIDKSGMISIIIPVLSDPANIKVSFADGASKSITAPVKDLSSTQRTIIAWSGTKDLHLQVDENAFSSSQNKQITTENARSFKESYLLGGGYLTALGNADLENGKFIQIYSTGNLNDVFVDFSIVLDNPNKLCGNKFSIKTVRYTSDLGPQSASKNISIRNCSTKNESIVLKNMLRNLIVAERN